MRVEPIEPISVSKSISFHLCPLSYSEEGQVRLFVSPLPGPPSPVPISGTFRDRVINEIYHLTVSRLVLFHGLMFHG
uniref:Uncharacterized protein n=1 Tax=Picea glauca TaxID=3330 RepID=A0A101LV41_PICGL|nr:hypothetical protein ABT39_MTgene2249 [Picea glauca]QHR86621.1 hypothetical protein Q903MT_gene624 [Picea sitchensis]